MKDILKKTLLSEMFGINNKPNQIQELKDYLTQDLTQKYDELALRFASPIIFNQYKKTRMDEDELIEFLENNKKERRSFAKWLIDELKNVKVKIHDLRLEDYPAWATLEYKQDFNNDYVIHFTDNAELIATQGFKYGVSNIEKIATTNLVSKQEKSKGGFNFGFLLKDIQTVNEYLKNSHQYSYGENFVIFKK